MVKNRKHNHIKETIILFFILCSTFVFSNTVFATEQSELEDKIENTINSVLQNYINNIKRLQNREIVLYFLYNQNMTPFCLTVVGWNGILKLRYIKCKVIGD